MSTNVMSKDKLVLVELEDIGEGICGDYDPDDKEDVPLLRFTVFAREDGEWNSLPDASYCTQIPATLPEPELVRLATLLLNEVEEPVRDGHSIKKLCERLSWVNKTWGTSHEDRGWVI